MGVGGAGVHWNGVTWRWLEWDHQARTRTVDKYGERIIPADMNLQDWPITYDDLEPYYDRFEKTCGTSGKAGNLNGQKIDGGNIFEGPRKDEVSQPAADCGAEHGDVRDGGAQSRLPSLPQSRIKRLAGLRQSGWRGLRRSVTIAASASASAARRMPRRARISRSFRWRWQNPNFELRTNAIVLKVNLDSTGKRAVSVTYLDARGREFEQPADLIILSAYALGNVHLLLHSGIGVPYDPATGKGVVGRNYAYQCGGGATAYFDEKTIINRFMGAGALGTCMDDFNGDSYDFEKAGYIGGGGISCSNSGARPIQYASDAARHAALGLRLEEGGGRSLRSLRPTSAIRAR